MRRVRRSVIKGRKRNQRGGASVGRVKRILRRGPSLTDKLAYTASMLLSGPALGFGTLVNFWENRPSKALWIMSSIKKRVHDKKKSLVHHACLVESMSMLLTLSSGVVALRSHHTYRLQRGWLHKIPYKRVPEDMEAEVLKYVMKPHLHPLHDCIFHLMTFMSYYDGKYTYMTGSHLYTQYLHKYWVTYHCFKLWYYLSWLRTLKKISRIKK